MADNICLLSDIYLRGLILTEYHYNAGQPIPTAHYSMFQQF
jgi:hypothetical protein